MKAAPGEEKFYCYHTSLPTAATGIHAITSSMTPGSHHMIVFKTHEAREPDGTFGECDGFGGSSLSDVPVWLYASQDPEGALTMPDGVGLSVAAEQPVIVNMHYVNTSDAPITADVHVAMTPYVPGGAYTAAHAYVTFNTQIDVAPGAVGGVSGSCDVPAGAKFISLSTHSHRYTTSARVEDGEDLVLETLDWEHATVERWREPYFSFSSGKLDYRCQYHNTTSERLETGESAIANEMCMAVGLLFPSDSDIYCLNSLTLTL